MRSIQEAPQSNRGGPGRVRRFASSPTRGVGIASSRRLATSPTAGPRSHRTADPEVCAREVSTRVGQVSGLTVTNVQLSSDIIYTSLHHGYSRRSGGRT